MKVPAFFNTEAGAIVVLVGVAAVALYYVGTKATKAAGAVVDAGQQAVSKSVGNLTAPYTSGFNIGAQMHDDIAAWWAKVNATTPAPVTTAPASDFDTWLSTTPPII